MTSGARACVRARVGRCRAVRSVLSSRPVSSRRIYDDRQGRETPIDTIDIALSPNHLPPCYILPLNKKLNPVVPCPAGVVLELSSLCVRCRVVPGASHDLVVMTARLRLTLLRR